MATIRDVAKLAGVSISTVSLSLSNPNKVSEKTLKRIREAISAVGYVVDPVAQSLARGSSRMIGFVVGNIGNPFFGEIRREIEDYALKHNYFLLAVESSGIMEREQELVRHLAGLKVAGLVIAPSGNGSEYINFLHQLKMPVVSFDQKVTGMEYDFVGSDNFNASSMLTEHLLQLGHKRIGFIKGPDQMHTAIERYRGYTSTLASADIDIDSSLVVNGQYTRDIGYEAATKLMLQRNPPTAILGANNVVSLSALQVIQELGLKCPDDISLAMIDDEQWSELITPRLTMVVQDTKRLGNIIAERLISRINDSNNEIPVQDFVLDSKFIIGNSCRKF
ncbi:LacI family DNA-binding transcriptional regulator [Vibrio sp. SCSIO 43132]|uniref:LacI family DNA-binding transcriptional regulator n=1 Tax=Vibrio sp. SCSIO 43132 TaxID=2779363 RepID=UPI001CA7D14F|nr:LacI family DNA-binding transcriptional regulator [Vibrio sp. SCSIO 43132]UAB69197.1 LacI family DNA-binding transcriptional regulator [Vibrio sp. SCSIO 43132]